jgi:hypothetical protein
MEQTEKEQTEKLEKEKVAKEQADLHKVHNHILLHRFLFDVARLHG